MNKTAFLIILTLAALLRFYHLGLHPPSLNLDEVAIGYNAYSIIKTGQDEYGQFLPVAFRSHDDYKAPLYIYLTSPLVGLLGLNPFSVRLISALSGTLTIVVAYFLAKKIDSRYPFPLLSAGLLAISPWHIQFSRMAYEANLALLLFSSATLFFLKGLDKPRWWPLSSSLYALSLWSYHSTKLILPLFVLSLIFLYHKKIRSHISMALISTTIFLVLSLPVIIFSFTPQGRLRFEGTSIFNQTNLIDQNRSYRPALADQVNSRQLAVFHHPVFSATTLVTNNYFKHFAFAFLFDGQTEPPINHTPNVGLFYLWQLPFLILGLASFIKNTKPTIRLLIIWLLMAPLPAALTWDTPSSTRTNLMILPLIFFVAWGISLGLKQFSSTLLRTALGFMVSFFVLHFWHHYYFVSPLKFAQSWQYGYDQAVDYTLAHQDEYDQIIISTNLAQPQNFWAFYSAYDPHIYINQDGGTKSGGFAETGNHFSNFYFHPIKSTKPNTLYVDLEKNAPKDVTILHTVYLPNQTPFIRIFTK